MCVHHSIFFLLAGLVASDEFWCQLNPMFLFQFVFFAFDLDINGLAKKICFRAFFDSLKSPQGTFFSPEGFNSHLRRFVSQLDARESLVVSFHIAI